MKRVVVQSRSGEYPVIIGRGASVNLTECCLRSDLNLQGREIVFVSDKNTDAIARKIAEQAAVSDRSYFLSVEPGEGSKSIATATQLWSALADGGISRAAVICAVGGGVVGDLAGYVASSWMRGIDLVQIPTTLMAQVDSSIGGKVGVNLVQGKNLVGAFYPPKLVVVDPQLLSSLPQINLKDGFAEVIKYGAIFGAELFELCERWLGSQDAALLQDIIERCVSIKARVVSNDEFEMGSERVALNFGHTVGHAIEAAAEFGAVSHGEAVAFGMQVEARFGVSLGITDSDAAGRISEMVGRFDFKLPVQMLSSAIPFLGTDKKRSGSRIKMALPRRNGDYVVESVELAELSSFIGDFRSNLACQR